MRHRPDTTAAPIALQITGLTHRYGQVTALNDAELTVERGQILSILGPSGCGKSTLLQLVAGHLTPTAGTITIGGTVVVDDREMLPPVPPQKRSVGMVFQDYALFPHLTVADNVCFGISSPRQRRALIFGRSSRRRARREHVAELLATFDIAALADRYPGELSGGQQQRVAIARAIAQRPDLLLLDEPFGNLDAATRERVRSEIVARLRATGITCVFVTHDQEEALAISDRVAVMQAGKVLQVDEPEVLYRRPFCLEVAEFLGRTNVLRGTARAGRVRTEIGDFEVAGAPDGEVELLVRPELIDVQRADAGSVTVVGREFRGHDVLYTLELPSGASVWAHRPSVHMAEVGDRVNLTLQPGTVTYVDQSPAAATSSAVAADVEPAAGRIVNSHSGTALIATKTSAGSAASA